MSFKKFGDSEKMNPVSSEEEEILGQHVAKTGKSIQDLNDQEREELHQDLDSLTGE